MKRKLALLILIAMLSSGIAGCASDQKDTPQKSTDSSSVSETTAANGITTYLEPIDEELEALDYGGESVVILERGTTYERTRNELWVEELTNDPVNDAVYNRNLMVNEMLGVEITTVESDDVSQKVDITVSSGDSTYDIVAHSSTELSPLILAGNMYNLYDNGIETYLDPTKPWWATQWIEEAEMCGRLYMITGAPALSLNRMIFAMFYNKDIAEEQELEDMYTVVHSGRWTVDYMNEVVSGMYRDLNGNSQIDAEDEFGFATCGYTTNDSFWSAFELDILRKTDDGWYEVADDSANKERLFSGFEKIFYLVNENPGTYLNKEESYEGVVDVFANGTALFGLLHLYRAEESSLRNMSADYGILPVPKYDESQKDYHSYVHAQYTSFMIPITAEDPRMSGAVLEAMAYESYKSVLPTYYDLVLKGRYVNDPQSREMLDIITQNVIMDAGIIYGKMLSYPETVLRSNIDSRSENIASSFESTVRTLPKVLKAIRKSIEALEY